MVQDELDGLKTDTADAMAAAALKDRIARTDRVHTAIGLDDPAGEAAKLMPANSGGGVSGVTAKRNAAGMVTVDVNGPADDDYAGGETNAGSSAWNSVTMTKTNTDDSTDMVVIYTDIEEPSDILFTMQYDRTMRIDILGAADRVKKAQSDSFPAGPTRTKTFGGESGNSARFSGMFDGVPGTYECIVSNGTCTLMTNAKGELETSKDPENWEFSPNNGLATVKDPDAAYGYFGWWLNKPEEADAEHSVEVFAGGVGDAVVINDLIVGTARYSGPAAGKYATKTFTAGVQTDAAVGHFTAAANLTAKFGNGSDVGEGISGLVSKFVLDDTNSVPWKVTLERATYSGANFNGTTEVDFGGGATATDAGSWQGTFYGAGAEDPDAPSTVVGRFGATTTDGNASVLGAFGATKQ